MGINRKSVKPTVALWTRENLAWCAGFLEGEGCFSLAKSSNRPGGLDKKYWYLNINVANTDLDGLEKLETIMGGVIHRMNKRPEGTKPIWRWSTSSKENVYAICVAILPWMGQRRTVRIKELIEAYKSPKYFHSPAQYAGGPNRWGYQNTRNERGQYCSA